MSSSPGTLEETHEGRASYLTHTCTSEPQIYSVCWREWGREGNTIPHLTHTWLTNLKSKQPATYPHTLHSRWIFLLLQTPFKSSLSSPQLPLQLMDLPPFAVRPPPIWSLLLRSPEAFWSEINRQFSTDSPSIKQTRPSLAPQPTSSFLPCYSLCVSSPPFLSALSLSIEPSHSFSLGNHVIFTDSATTCSVKTTQAPCSSQVSPSDTRLLLPMACRMPPPSTSR